MAEALRGRMGNAAGAFTSNARNPDLRRAQLSFLGAWTAEWAFTVGLGIVGLPGRRRDGRRAGGTAADGPVRHPRTAVVAPGGQGPPGARAHPGLRDDVTTCIDVTEFVGHKIRATAAHRTQYPIDPNMFPDRILREMFGVEYFTQVLPERELRTSLLDD